MDQPALARSLARAHALPLYTHDTACGLKLKAPAANELCPKHFENPERGFFDTFSHYTESIFTHAATKGLISASKILEPILYHSNAADCS